MYTKRNQPKWWQLYLTFPLLIALFVGEHRLELTDAEHQALQLGILVIVFLLIFWWLRNNSSALSRMDRMEYHKTFTVIHIPPYNSEETDQIQLSLRHKTYSEIKGVLSDTFEIESDASRIEQASQQISKE